MTEPTAVRHQDFRTHHLLWLVVQHYLSADLLRELCAAVIDAASNGSLTLGDLCEQQLTGDSPMLSNWAVRMKPGEDGLPSYLQRLIQVVVWQGDQSPGVYEREGDAGDLATMKALEAAMTLAHADLSLIAQLAQRGDPPPAEIHPFVKAMLDLKSRLDDGGPVETGFGPFVKSDSPLGAMLVKHLGDLCGDADRWDAALTLYGSADILLAECSASPWRDLKNALTAMLMQSKASALRFIDGPAAAVRVLTELVDSATIDQNAVAVINAPRDQMAAYSALNALGSWRDTRGSVALAPQLVNAHPVSNALSFWVDRRFSDAHRWFWAVLRRQIAFGSATHSRETKAYYGLCLIEAIEAKLGSNRSISEFDMATRLLVESGQHESVKRSEWSSELVEAYVDEAHTQAAIVLARRHKGSTGERTMVVLALFGKWLKALPPPQIAAAGTMMRFLAEAAAGGPGVPLKDRDIGTDALKTIKSVGKERPEFRAICAPAIADAILATLDRGNIIEIGEAISTAQTYIKDFSDEVLTTIAGRILSMAEATEVGAGSWSVVRPALAFLSSRAVMERAAPDTAFRKRIVAELLRLSLENESEHETIMYLLRDLEPGLIDGQVDGEKLESVVAVLCERARQTNSSAAVSAMQALLVAPAVAKRPGVEAALAGLRAALESAGRGRPDMAFADAYHPLLLLAQHRDEIARGLALSDVEVVEMISPLLPLVKNVWVVAAQKPMIFSGFAIPERTAPHAVLVHNWTFASLDFAKSLGAMPAMTAVMKSAAEHPELEKAMSVARAVRVSAGDPELFESAAISRERREAFYAALGQRLVLLRDLTGDTRKDAIMVMLDQCLRVGPHGLDAGLFLAALEWCVRIDRTSSDARGYRERLLNDRLLRQGLAPLFDRAAKAYKTVSQEAADSGN